MLSLRIFCIYPEKFSSVCFFSRGLSIFHLKWLDYMVNKTSSSIADLAGEVQSLTKRQDKSERETSEAMKRAPPPHHGDERHANAKRSRVTVTPSDEEYGPYGVEESDDTNPDEDCAADSDCELIDQIDALLKPPSSKETESDANAQDDGWLA